MDECDDDLMYRELQQKVVKIGPRVVDPPEPADSEFVDYVEP